MSEISDTVEQLTQAHLRNVQQLAVFYTGHDDIYAINIAKVKAFIITEEIMVSSTPAESEVISGIATIRGEPITLINLDKWIGHNALPIKDYKLIIYCEYNHRKVGFLIKDMINIVEKTTDELNNTEEQNKKITYTTYVDVKGESMLCTVFNAEQLLVDIGWMETGSDVLDKYVRHPVDRKKVILAAEDSAVARKVLIDFFEKANAKYEIFPNGKELLNRLEEAGAKDIGLVISDIEMPETDGYQVLQAIKDNSKYASIPVVINSSMTTAAVKHKMELLGADDFIGKTDIPSLYDVVVKHIGTV